MYAIRSYYDAKMKTLVEEMNNGKVGALFILNANPAYDYPEADKFISGLSKVKLSVSFDSAKSETAKLAGYVCPDSNYLESWNDAEIQPGKFSLAQPTMHKLFDTRQASYNFV